MEILTYILILFISLITGIISGVLAIGGGTIIVPLLTEIVGLDIRTAVATSLIAMIFTAGSSAYGHYRAGYMDRKATILMASTGIPMAVAGAYLTVMVPVPTLRAVFGIVIILSAAMMYISIHRQGENEKDTPTSVEALLAGVVGGFASGLLGIGGGAVMVPVLILLARVKPKVSISSVSFVVFLNAIFGGATHLLVGNGDIVAALIIATATIPGAQIGVKIFGRLESRAIKYIYAVFLVVIGIKMIFF